MIIPTLPTLLYRLDGYDLHGKPQMRLTGRIKVAPVKLVFESAHTTVRTDSAGSIGHAEEEVASVVVLALPAAKVQIGDVLGIGERRVEVFKIRDRHTVTGKLHHHELHCRVFK